MNVKISNHALLRLKERGISEQEVLNYFSDLTPPIIADSSRRDPSCVEITRVFSGRICKIIYSVETNTVVTIYPVR